MYLESKSNVDPVTGKTKYLYLIECPECKVPRWQSNAKSTKRCKPCAGRITYNPVKVDRKDKRQRGQGYITKQGYHLVFDGKNYIPAHRTAFPDIPVDWVVHHIDGDKLNNVVSNLLPLSKSTHRELHGQLETLSYLLIQCGLIVFNRDTCTYALSSSLQKCSELISVNSGDTLTSGVEGNPEPSLVRGRCNDYPIEEYTQVSGSAEHLNK